MDSTINSALEEICARGAAGILLSELWPAISVAADSVVVKKAIWLRLLPLPCLRFQVSDAGTHKPSSRSGLRNGLSGKSLEEAERLRVRVFAEDHLRDSFVGIDDRKSSASGIKELQRSVLDRLAAARASGITQCDLAKEFGIKGNNFFYTVRSLESQQLIVRQSTIVREKEMSEEVGNGPKNTIVSNTNLVRLYRYANSGSLNSQQRIEITRSAWGDMLESMDTDESSSIGDVACWEGVMVNVQIKDHQPAMKAICDKLEETHEKIRIVSDIKLALGYRFTQGHRHWRNIINRMTDAGLVETIYAKVKEKDVPCLRLLKRFDPNNFQPKTNSSKYDGFDSEIMAKHGRRGEITDQLLELPMEHLIYDMVDAEGPKGITAPEVCRRLGLNSKKMYSRIISMCSRFGMGMECEFPNKAKVFRVWTRGNYHQYSSSAVRDVSALVGPDISEFPTKSTGDALYGQSSPDLRHLHSISQDEVRPDKTRSEVGIRQPAAGYELAADAHLITHNVEVQKLSHGFSNDDECAEPSNSTGTVKLNVILPERCHASSMSTQRCHASSMSTQGPSFQSLASNLVATKREQRILEKLKDEKFILICELFRWLNDIKDKPTTMDRKTMNHNLNNLQREGLCKIIKVTLPVATNFHRVRKEGVILHPSVGNISSDLLDQIHRRSKHFLNERSLRSENKTPLAGLKISETSSNHTDPKPALSTAMYTNGFIIAKMVRAKLLHYFLWGYLDSLHDWKNTIHSTNDDYDLKIHRHTFQFAINEAIKEMPLQLFLQIVGYPKTIDDMIQKCRLRLRLSDLSVLEYKCLVGNTNATGRLSRLVDILLRLKLIEIFREGPVEGLDVLSRAIPTHAMKLQPYIEEPLPRVLQSSNIDALELRPRLRHDFVLSNLEAVDAYWETLEYCYARADPTASSHAFPCSVVREVFGTRAWTSLHVMSAEQRMELLKRLKNDSVRISFKERVQIAEELSLTVEQVLRFSRQYKDSSTSKSNDQANHMAAHDKDTSALKKRKTSKEESFLAQDGSNVGKNFSMPVATEDHNPIGDCNDDNDGHDEELNSQEELDQSIALVSKCAFSRLKPGRRKRFSWTDEFDRKLIMHYARKRAAMGERFHRVDWPSLSDLPAPSVTCSRRMAALRSDKRIRRAIMKLCNLLGERYGRYLHTLEKAASHSDSKSVQRTSLEETVRQSTSRACGDSFSSEFQHDCWDNFDDPDIQITLNEILRCKRIAKLEHAKRIGTNQVKGWSDNPETEQISLDFEEHVMSKEQNSISSNPVDSNDMHNEGLKKNINTTSKSSRSRSSSHQRKFIKILNSRGLKIRKQVCESLVVANAVELLKLVFLSNSAAHQASLAATLRLYSECDLFLAFSYLKEKNFMIIGHGSQPFVLSPKFWHNASSSVFPIGSGKRASNFSSWLHKHDYDLEDGVNLTSDLQCGEILHLFALVSLEEVLISPFVPKEGTGEADEPKSSTSVSPMDDIDGFVDRTGLKRKSDEGIQCRSENIKKHKHQGKMDGDFDFRREKGFPGIKVLLNRGTIPRADAVRGMLDTEKQTCFDGINKRISSSDMQIPSFVSSSNNLCSSRDFGDNIQSEMSSNEPVWDMMAKSAAQFSSTIDGDNEAITCPELFRSVHSVICQAGEEGLSTEEISKIMGMQGAQHAELAVDTLECFQLAYKVNAYDCVKVVDSSHRSKYFIGIGANHSPEYVMASSMSSQGMRYGVSRNMSCGKHDNIYDSQCGTSMKLSCGHKVTTMDLPPRSAIACIGTQLVDDENMTGQRKIVEAVSMKENNSGNNTCPPTGVPLVYHSILPWINSDGSTNTIIFKGLTRRVLGTVMQNPGVLEEDIIAKMDVLNPQTCRQLLGTMVHDNDITVRMVLHTASAPPSILQSLFHSNICKPRSEIRKHYFANPMSTAML